MSSYRQGAVLGFTIAEAFILLTFLLLIALLGLNQEDEPQQESVASNVPRVWVRPEKIETLVKSAEQARKAQEEAEQARAIAERERDQALEKIEEGRKAKEEAEQARKAQEEAEQARAVAERERDQALEKAEERRKAEEEAEQARAITERERDQALEKIEEGRKAEEEAAQSRDIAERERDQARNDLALIRHKGANPPCWYQVVSTDEGKTREKPYYAFNVAIYENSIELAPREVPPGGACDDMLGGACDDRGGLYADEWKRLQIEDLPYGKPLSDNEFSEAISDLVAQGRNRQVRTYGCVFSVMVWDKTPDHSKKRWKDAHDGVIEGSFSAYTVQDLEWAGVD